MAYNGPSAEAARQAADYEAANDLTRQLNDIARQYEREMNLATAGYTESAKLQNNSIVIGRLFPDMKSTLLAMSLNGDKLRKAADKKVLAAQDLFKTRWFYYSFARPYVHHYKCYKDGQQVACGTPGSNSHPVVYHEVVCCRRKNLTFQQAIDQANYFRARANNAVSYSFGISIGSGGINLSAGTYATLAKILVDEILEVVVDIGIISQSTYEDIKQSSLWQFVLNTGVNLMLGAGISKMGLTSSSIGYVNASVLNSEGFAEADAYMSKFKMVGEFLASRMDGVDSLIAEQPYEISINESRERRLFRKRSISSYNRFMPLNVMMEKANTKHDRIKYIKLTKEVENGV